MADPGSKEPRKPSVREPTGEHSTDVVATKKEFIQTFFRRAEEFTETLLRENERLRFQIVELEDKLRRSGGGAGEPPSASSLRELVDRIEGLEREKEQLLARFRSVETQNVDFVERYREIE